MLKRGSPGPSMGLGRPEAMAPPGSGPGPGKKRIVRALFILVLLVWPVQYLFSDLVVEPWPALMMPRFTHLGASVDPSDRYTLPVEIVAYTQAGRPVVVPQRELLRDVPLGKHKSVFRFQFTPDSDPAFGTRQYLLDRLPSVEWLITHYPLNNYFKPRMDLPLGNSVETRHWLRGQLSRLYPGQEFERVEFTWFEVPVAVSHGQLLYGQKEEVTSYVVELH